MNKINIKRITIIVGPTSQGKTTLSKRIKEEAPGKAVIISHDEVLSLINKRQSQCEIDFQFRIALLKKLTEAINDLKNDYIIIDTVNISKKSLESFLSVVNTLSDSKHISLLKLNISQALNLLYAKKHYPEIKNISENVLKQRRVYSSVQGSLHTTYFSLVNKEYVIENGEVIQFEF